MPKLTNQAVIAETIIGKIGHCIQIVDIYQLRFSRTTIQQTAATNCDSYLYLLSKNLWNCFPQSLHLRLRSGFVPYYTISTQESFSPVSHSKKPLHYSMCVFEHLVAGIRR